jgi:uncharacterized protein (DUF305 family)
MEHPHKSSHSNGKHAGNTHNHYPRLYLMAVLSFVAMFILMYAMVDRFANVYANLNQVYMAALMAAPMVGIEIALMTKMYPDKKKNVAIVTASVLVGVLCWGLIRQQAVIGNAQFLRSMIPHHAGAVLMCEKLKANDLEIKRLCEGIIRSQQAEIAQMKAKLADVS